MHLNPFGSHLHIFWAGYSSSAAMSIAVAFSIGWEAFMPILQVLGIFCWCNIILFMLLYIILIL